MIVTNEQIKAAIAKYVDIEIAPKATGMAKFAIYFLVPSIPKLVDTKIEEYRAGGLLTDCFNADGNIILDEVYARAKNAIQHSGRVLLPKIDFWIDETDIEKLYNILKNI